jgi:two-component system KDP operon response regulator KdpE
VVLDILLSGEIDGYALAERIREFRDVPIIFLTGKVREADMLRGFEVGADDYITKPFSSKELLARVGAVLRRIRKDTATQPVEITCGSLRIDLARRVVYLNGRPVHLTPTEYSLLHEMVVHKNQVLVHEHLLTAVWGSEYRDDVDYLRAYIHHLRGKIEQDPANPQVIIRCPGVGYMLVCPEDSITPTEKPNPFE